MSTFLIQLGMMSVQASVAIAVVLLLRKVFAVVGISKKYVMLLWVIPFWLLICPWKISSPMALWNSAPSDYDTKRVVYELEQLQHEMSEVEIHSVEAPVDEVVPNEMPPKEPEDSTTQNSLKAGITDKEIGAVWGTGTIVFFAYAMISYLHLKQKVRCSIWKVDNVYYVDYIPVPMVVGIVKPKIFLPSGMDESYASYVIAHENTHIKRKDPLIKFVAYVIVCIHWFNPIVWLAYYFLEKDMEMACDEETIQHIGTEKKKEYATALLQLSTGTRTFFSVPLAFGEGDAKGRIKNVLNYKKTVKAAAILAVATGLLVLAVFMTKGDEIPNGDEGVDAGVVIGSETMDNLMQEEGAMQELEDAVKEAEDRVQEAMLAEKEAVERQALLIEINGQRELTFDMVRKAEEKHILHELAFHDFENGEIMNFEDSYALNYYVNFFFDYEGEQYRLGVSFMKDTDLLDCIYITRLSDDDMRWIYSAEKNSYSDQLEIFLSTKEQISDWLTVELPEGYTIGTYNANYGYMGGALIFPQAYELYGEETFAPADWYHAGCISRMPDAMERYEFIDGKLQEHRGVPWNHTSSEFIEVLDLDWQAVFMEVNHDLYTAADMVALEEEGIDTSQIDLTSDYWYFFFAKEGEDTSYYLSLAKNCFSREEAIAIAETVDIKE